MSQVINTNSLSLLTQNNLNKSQSALNTAIERLSSGMRINSAKDDAAGQAIANRFTANIKGLTQASRNANDGISIAQTTEGALTEVNNNLQRIRELSVQAANGTNSQSDLDSIQDEIGQRLQEIDRVSEQTQFNGVKVLSADAKTLTIQVGANDNENIAINLEEISADTLNLSTFNVNGTSTPNAAAKAADLATKGYSVSGSADVDGTQTYSKSTDVVSNNVAAKASDLLSKVVEDGTVTAGGSTYTKQADGSYLAPASAAAPVGVGGGTGISAIVSTTATVTIGSTDVDVKVDASGNLTLASDGSTLYVDGTGNLSTTDFEGNGQASMSDLVASMEDTGNGTGGTIKVTGGAVDKTYTLATGGAATTDDWTLTSGAESLTAAEMQTKLEGLSAAGAATVDLDGTASDVYTVGNSGAVVTDAANSLVYVDAAGTNGLSDDATSTKSEVQNLYLHSDGTVTNSSGAQQYLDSAGELTSSAATAGAKTTDPLAAIDAALSKVDKLRSSLGAVQNRFDSAIANLGTTITNLSSSRSRIEDADYAVEVSNMTRAQILQQAGTSVLSQANQTTQGVLSLLR